MKLEVRARDSQMGSRINATSFGGPTEHLPRGDDIVVLLEGIDISEQLSALTLRMSEGERHLVTISILPDEVIVDAEVLAHLEAFVEAQKVARG